MVVNVVWLYRMCIIYEKLIIVLFLYESILNV